MAYSEVNVVTCMQERPIRKPRPSFVQLPELFDQFGGNISAVAQFLGYSRDQVYTWINEAHPDIKIGLNERLAKARYNAEQAAVIDGRAKNRRNELPAFILPHEVKTLVGLYYRLTWDQLQQADIKEILHRIDEDPDAPRALRHKLSWEQVRQALGDINAGFTHTFRIYRHRKGKASQLLKEWQEDLGGPVTVDGVTYTGWHEHALMSWVGEQLNSPLCDHYDLDALPQVITSESWIDENGIGHTTIKPYGPHIENALRLMIQRLEAFL